MKASILLLLAVQLFAQPHVGDQFPPNTRGPVAMVYWSSSALVTAENPRGYGPRPKDVAKTPEEFLPKRLRFADELIAKFNAMPVRPGLVMFWDVEGARYHPGAGYLGAPNLLPVIAPDMDAAIEPIIQRFRVAGYRVGLTIRPQKLLAGYALPGGACQVLEWDVRGRECFILANDDFGKGFYKCNDSGQWELDTELPINKQGCQTNDREMLQTEQLQSKINYAYWRLGVKDFYIDSNVRTEGGPISYQVMEALRRTLPADVLLIPEHGKQLLDYYRYAAVYTENLAGTPPGVRALDPKAFSVLRLTLKNAPMTPDTVEKLTAAVLHGDMLMFEQFRVDHVAMVNQAYQNAAVAKRK